MRVAVFGAGGLLGHHLVEELTARGLEVAPFDRQACPIEDGDRVARAVEGKGIVYNAAAYTNVDGAERDREIAFQANEVGPANIARAAARVGAVVVHVSTDFVFDGALDRPYREGDSPNPQSTYARSKRAGEIQVESLSPRHHLVRVQGLYGRGGRNFSSRLRDLLLTKTSGLRIDAERKVQPTWARAAARAIADLSQTDHFGTWHVSCRGATTWHGFTQAMASRLGLPQTWEGVSSSALALPAARPPNCLFENERLVACGVRSMPRWEEALDEYLSEEGAK